MKSQSWKEAIAKIIARMPEEFRLGDFTAFQLDLARQFPQNRFIDAKIRQTLQVLRDQGVLEFLGQGRYRKLHRAPQFSCLLDMSVAEGFTSRSQIARIVLETWASMNLYCVHCARNDLSALPANAVVSDLMCAECSAQYQLKSKEGRFGDKVMGGEFNRYVAAAKAGAFPHLMLVEWDRRFSSVFVVRAISGSTVTPDRILPRNRLSVTAKRAGWQGCMIDIEGLKTVDLVVPKLRPRDETRALWTKLGSAGS